MNKAAGKSILFEFENLPPDIQQRLIAKELECLPELIPSRSIDEDRIQFNMCLWDSATEDYRRQAKEKLRSLKLQIGLEKKKGRKRFGGRAVFKRLQQPDD